MVLKDNRDRKTTIQKCQTYRRRFIDFYLKGLLLKGFKRYNHVVMLVWTQLKLQDRKYHCEQQ